MQTVGNHDCDYGADTLANYTLKVNFPIVVANMNASAHPVLSQTIQPYTIITLNNGVQVRMLLQNAMGHAHHAAGTCCCLAPCTPEASSGQHLPMLCNPSGHASVPLRTSW